MFSKKSILSVVAVYACAGLIVACAKKSEGPSSRARSARGNGTATNNRETVQPPAPDQVKKVDSKAVCKKKGKNKTKAYNECIAKMKADEEILTKTEAEKKAKAEAEAKIAAEAKAGKPAKPDPEAENKGGNAAKINPSQIINSGIVNLLKVPSEDYLRGFIQDHLAKEKNADLKLKNKQLAEKISYANLKFTGENRKFIVTVKMNENGKEELLTFNGELKDDLTTTQVDSDKKAGETESKAKASLVCMDKKQYACDAAIFDIRLKQNDVVSKAFIVFRKNYANFTLEYPKNANWASAEYKKFFDLFNNSANKVKSGNALSQILVTSYEVVTEDSVGSTNTRVKMQSYDNEVITYNGEMGFTSADEIRNEELNRTTIAEEQIDTVTGLKYSTSINDSIEKIVFRTNNGEGQLRADFYMKKLANGNQDVLRVGVAKIITVIRSSSVVTTPIQ